MRTIQTKTEYKALCDRIEDLLAIVNNNTPTSNKDFIELDLLSDLVASYEELHEPVEVPTLIETIKLRMYERDLSQRIYQDY